MNWLARMELHSNIVHAKGVWDNYVWHKRIWQDCFSKEQNAKRDFLTRIDSYESMFRVWILSQRKPHCPKWCPKEGFALKEIAPGFLLHRYYAFDLLANPVKTIMRVGPDGQPLLRPNGKRKNGKRIPLVKKDELYAWIERKGRVRCRDQSNGHDVPGGFRIVKERPLEISPMVENHFRKNGHSAYHGGVQFRGILEVTDQKSFIETYQSGIGSAKSFGFGMLLLAPVNL